MSDRVMFTLIFGVIAKLFDVNLFHSKNVVERVKAKREIMVSEVAPLVEDEIRYQKAREQYSTSERFKKIAESRRIKLETVKKNIELLEDENLPLEQKEELMEEIVREVAVTRPPPQRSEPVRDKQSFNDQKFSGF
jgi:hypothetical protein